MRKIPITVLVVTLVGILAVGTCIAGVPSSISYQGRLTDTLGQPVSDGAYPVQFKLYDAGALFWTSAPQNVTTSGGVFTTQLSPLAASDLAGRTDVWMEMLVGSPLVALSPRTKFASVPYALISGDSWSLLGNTGAIPGTNFIGTTDNQPLEFKVNGARVLRLEPGVDSPNVIGGYSANSVTSGVVGATISGGGDSANSNLVTDVYGTIGGGRRNQAGDGAGATTDRPYATIAGGFNNAAGGFASVVGGGEANRAEGFTSGVLGGESNVAGGQYAAVGGGYGNTAGADWATVPGGAHNTALGIYSFAAGQRAIANHDGAFVWADNSSEQDFASTAADQFLIKATGGVGIGINDPAAALDVNGLVRSRTGGFQFPDGTTQTTAAASGTPKWSLAGNADTVPGTNFIGTTDDKALEFRVNNTCGFRLEPTTATPNIIGGYSGNTVTSGVYGATISGGGQGGNPNSVTISYGTVGGGAYNTAGGLCATVGGGYWNTASGNFATVGGGGNNAGFGANTASGYDATVGGGAGNTASGSYATVAGGGSNTASGFLATVGGGNSNTALGDYSFAAGRRAKANHNGALVWADSTDVDFASTAANQFLIKATGGVGINTSSPVAGALDVNGLIRSRTGGVQFPDGTTQTTAASAGAPSWSLAGNGDTIPGTSFIGTTDNKALVFKVYNTHGFRLEPTTGTPNVIGGYSGNTVAALVTGATISGGGSSGNVNSVTGSYGAIGGGGANTASGLSATVGGGGANTASGTAATVGGGVNNTASGFLATVGGGNSNTALGDYSFAAGRRAKANHNGALVWADSTDVDFASTAANQFLIKATGGVGIGTNSPTNALSVAGNVDVTGNLSFANTVGDKISLYASGTTSYGIGLQNYLLQIHTAAGAEDIAFGYGSSGAMTETMRIKGTGDVGIGTSSPGYKLDVNGSLHCIGFSNTSDLRYKTNIETISNSLDKVMKLRGVNFDWKKSDYPEIAFGDGRQVGFVAQEIAQVLPEVVSKDGKGVYSVAYGSVVPVLVEALKEQQKTIDELRAKNAEMDRRLAAIEARTEKN